MKSYDALRPFTYLKGGPFQGPDDILVDDIYTQWQARENRRPRGPFQSQLSRAWNCCPWQGGAPFLSACHPARLEWAQGKGSALYVKTDSAANTDAVVNEIKNVPGMSTYVVQSMSEYLSMFTPDKYPMLSTFINIVIGISVTIGFIVIFQAMYTAVMERTREIGILKSLGASKFYIVNVILRETALLAIGWDHRSESRSASSPAPEFRSAQPCRWRSTSLGYCDATFIAIVGALGGALYPAFKAAQKDPIDALAYE